MIKSSATVCLVDNLKKGPWIYWHDLEASARHAASLGFDAIELFTESAEQLSEEQLRACLESHNLSLAAVGTGAGKVLHDLDLTHPEEEVRTRARGFIASMIDFGAPFGAPAIIGSMQGKIAGRSSREQTLTWLAQGLEELGQHAQDKGVVLIYEMLNRYESDLLNSLDDAAEFLASLKTQNVRLLADLFHMNIEEASIEDAITRNGEWIGHVHLADSNRDPAGCGHTDLAAAGRALRSIGFSGYASAEAFPHPSPEAAAQKTIEGFRMWFADDD